MVGTAQSPLSRAAGSLKPDLLAIAQAGIAAASAGRAVARALNAPHLQQLLSRPFHVVSAGKAAASMMLALGPALPVRTRIAVGTHAPADLPATVEWHEAAHPLPDEASVKAGARVLELARGLPRAEPLLLLLSGGASALLSAPAPDISLEDKRLTIEQMMRAGADIHALNTVRKHLSAIKGGLLAAASASPTMTLAVSDVIDDDVSVIGSGPGVADASTWSDAAAAMERFGGASCPASVRARVAAGVLGLIADTPKAGNHSMRQAFGFVIATRRDALEGARAAAETLGYHTIVVEEPIAGEARVAAHWWLAMASEAVAAADAKVCVISAGETTVRVIGAGRGGRNQEFVLALAPRLADAEGEVAVGSVGTDGIDGPTDAAGAIADGSTIERAATRGLGDPMSYLDDNNSYAFFDALGDLIRTGRTDTNVGDLQILLVDRC